MRKNLALYIKKFFELESTGSSLLLISAIVAIICANTSFKSYYDALLFSPILIQIHNISINKPLLFWINDGLMTIFFFVIGLELKREFCEGVLSDTKNILLPLVGAIGGILFPAAIYLAFNYNDPVLQKGWAIPTATDIAFSLGVLSLFGKRVGLSTKIFLMCLAMFDDIAAILIIAIFYTKEISIFALSIVFIAMMILYYLNTIDCMKKSIYILIGIMMWVAAINSGVHATLAGILFALFIPIKSNKQPDISILKDFETRLHPPVAFIILPIFAFSNSGIQIYNISMDALLNPLTLGILLGLFVGKQLGVFLLCFLFIKCKIIHLPEDMNLIQLYGAGILTGIGFTMSLFIGTLAFSDQTSNLIYDERLGIMLGSLLSGFMGYAVLRSSIRN